MPDDRTRIWLKKDDTEWVLTIPGWVVLGYVFIENAKWGWEARTNVSYRALDTLPPRGYVNTLEQAKEIVEMLLVYSGTVQPK